MSKSLHNCIYLSDDKEVVEEKIKKMYTDPLHINVSDPGHIEGNTVFTYLDAFSTKEYFEKFLPEYQNLEELKEHYQKGGLGDVKIKKFLGNILQDVLDPIREKRKYYENRMPEVIEMLKEGTKKANITADKTLMEIKDAMGINYFSDEDFINGNRRI